MNIATLADDYYALQNKRFKLQHEVDVLVEQETAIRMQLVELMDAAGLTSAAGNAGRVTVKFKEVPKVEDWDALYRHILKTKHFDLLQRRIGEAAVKERWTDGKKVPGVGVFEVKQLTVGRA